MNRGPVFHIAPIDQGQIVEVSYAAWNGSVIRCTIDRGEPYGSPEREAYATAPMLRGDEGDYWNAAPSNRRWRKCANLADALKRIGYDD